MPTFKKFIDGWKIRHECVNQKTMRHSPCHGKVESSKEFLTGFEEGEKKEEGTAS